MTKFFDNGELEDTDIQDEVNAQVDLNYKGDQIVARRDLYLTLLVLFVFKKQFNSRTRHWGFQAKRAKDTLKEFGITDPDELMESFSLTFKHFDDV